jgi:hypothetical protein
MFGRNKCRKLGLQQKMKLTPENNVRGVFAYSALLSLCELGLRGEHLNYHKTPGWRE